MSEPIGTKVDLRGMLSPEEEKEKMALPAKKRGYLHFKKSLEGGKIEHTYIKIIRFGKWRKEGVIMQAPMTEDEMIAENAKLEKELAEEAAKNGLVEDVSDVVQIVKKSKKRKEQPLPSKI